MGDQRARAGIEDVGIRDSGLRDIGLRDIGQFMCL